MNSQGEGEPDWIVARKIGVVEGWRGCVAAEVAFTCRLAD